MAGELGEWWIRSAIIGRLGGSCRREDPGVNCDTWATVGSLGGEGKRRKGKKEIKEGKRDSRRGRPCRGRAPTGKVGLGALLIFWGAGEWSGWRGSDLVSFSPGW